MEETKHQEECTCECEEETCNCNDSSNGEDMSHGTCKCKQEEGKEKKKKDKKKTKNLEEQIASLELQVKEFQEKSLRDQAELINYRKRKDEETSRMLKYSNEDLIKDMLPIIDSFEQAIKMDDDNLEDEVSKFLEGFKMVYCNLLNILNNFGVKAIDGANKPFDAMYHQAVLTEKVEGIETDQVIEVLQKGYLLKDKVIRPAMVKVSE